MHEGCLSQSEEVKLQRHCNRRDYFCHKKLCKCRRCPHRRSSCWPSVPPVGAPAALAAALFSPKPDVDARGGPVLGLIQDVDEAIALEGGETWLVGTDARGERGFCAVA